MSWARYTHLSTSHYNFTLYILGSFVSVGREAVLRVWQVVEGPLPWCVQHKYNGLWAVGKTEDNKEVLTFDKRYVM